MDVALIVDHYDPLGRHIYPMIKQLHIYENLFNVRNPIRVALKVE